MMNRCVCRPGNIINNVYYLQEHLLPSPSPGRLFNAHEYLYFI